MSKRAIERQAAAASNALAAKKEAKPAAPPSDADNQAGERRAQRNLSIYGFGFLGFLMTFLWGANSLVTVENSSIPLLQALRVTAAVATNTAKWDSGLALGIIGLAIGASFGYSIFLPPRLMFLGWLGGLLGLAALSFTGSAFLGGLGWAIGFVAAVIAAAKVLGHKMQPDL